VAYKKDVDDLRESPTLKIMQLLQQRGAQIDYNDPYFPQLHKMRHYNYENMKSVQLNPQTIGGYDAVVVVRIIQLRLLRHCRRRKAGGGHAQRHTPRDASPRQDRALLAICEKMEQLALQDNCGLYFIFTRATRAVANGITASSSTGVRKDCLPDTV